MARRWLSMSKVMPPSQEGSQVSSAVVDPPAVVAAPNGGTKGYTVGAVRSVRTPSPVVVEAKRRNREVIQAAKVARRRKG